MKNRIYPIIAGFFILTSAATLMNVNNKIDDGFKIKFESKDPTGTFDEMNGTINFDENNLEGSSFDLSFPISSINTENKMRDKKAQTHEWFDAATYPSANYKSSSIVKTDKGYNIKGTMTIKGVSKSLMVPMLVKTTDNGMVLYGGFGLNRLDYKVGKPNGTVPDVMNVKFYIPISK